MSEFKICPNCGAENDKDFAACDKCGAPLDDDHVIGEENVEKEQKATEENKIAKMLKVIANILYVASFFVGMVRFFDGEENFIWVWLVGFMSGTVFLGFYEIIRLLHEINQKK